MSIQSLYPSTRPSLNLDFANTKTLDPRITFSRASTATYYDGKTFAKAEENLLTYSQELDNASGWGDGIALSITSGQTAPDGTSTAFLLTSDGTNTQHALSHDPVKLSALPYTFSIYAKAGTHNFVQLRFGAAFGAQAANFDLSSGTVGSTWNGITSTSITSFGGGWYRCSVTATVTAATTGISIYIPSDGSSASAPTNTVSGTMYLWGWQLEQRNSETVYIPTTDKPITRYVPQLMTAASNVARFDHNPTTGESLGLLIEESRTNLLTYSEQFNNAAWNKSSATITANAITAPDGAVSADLTAMTNTIHVLRQLVTVAESATYTFSFYAKRGTATDLKYSVYNVTAGTAIIGATSYFSQTSSSGWTRISVTFTTPAGCTSIYVYPLRDSGVTGDVYIWGAQLEAGSFPTSYIPTTTAQVTRAKDAVYADLSSLNNAINQTQGTICIDTWRPFDDPGNRFSAALFTGEANYLGLDYASGKGTAGAVYWRNNSVGANSLAPSTNPGYSATKGGKYAVAFGPSDFAVSAVGATTATLVPSQPNPSFVSLQIGRQASGAFERALIYFKRLTYYPVRLSDSQLQALTT